VGVAGGVLFALALWVLHRELRHVDYPELARTIRAVPLPRLLLAFFLMVANYAVLTAYDHLAFVYIGRRLDAVRVTLASFVAYALANNVGFALLSGGAVRYRFYSRWGLSAADLSRVVFCYSTTYWLGLMALSGWSLAIDPLPGLTGLVGAAPARALGYALLLSVVAYEAAAVLRREPLRIRGFELALPRPGIALAQLVVSVVDWLLAGSVLHALLPAHSVGLGPLMAAFVAAQILALVSHVPGGLGVFETSMVVLLRGSIDPGVLLSALVLFRAVYYLVPLALAMIVLLVDEILQHRERVARLGTIFGAASDELAPRVFAVFTFIAGAVLLFSGATPTEVGRASLVEAIVPLAVMDAWHLAGSVVGSALLLVSHGVARRLSRAYYAAMAALALGVCASLLKGGDYEEALILGVLLLVLAKSGDEFERSAAFFATRFSVGWFTAVVGVVGASVWLGIFAYKHVAYAPYPGWRFLLDHGDVPRFLRATLAASAAVVAFSALRMLRPGRPPVDPPDDAALARATAIIAGQSATLPYLVFLRDKSLLFSPGGDAFLMYAVRGRTWAALGDPVGSVAAAPGLIRAFLERCDDYGGQPAFFEASAERLQQYAEFGLTFVKLGDAARIPLAAGTATALGDALDPDDAVVRVAAPADVPALLPALRAVSDEWLASKGGREKGFAVGFFDEGYVRSFPVVVVERGGSVEAFAVLWPGPDRAELSVDLIRFRSTASRTLMDAMLVHVMAYGRAEGYAWLNLGMAPPEGGDLRTVAPLWRRVGGWVYRHGEAFSGFEDLRAYKQKLDPVWEPRYLAYSGAMPLPAVLTDIATLIAGSSRCN
jgi:phosphatidylglycerol lysyltransferase